MGKMKKYKFLSVFLVAIIISSCARSHRATMHDYLILSVKLIVSSQGYKTYTVFLV